MSTCCYILNLPIEILDLVYKYLPDMRDKLNFAKAHGFLGKAFALHVGDIFKIIKIGARPILDWRDILSLCGSSVTGIQTWEVNTAVDAVMLASMYCPNLEEFFFPVRSSFWEVMKPLLLTLQNLDRIEISNSFENVNVVETLQQLPKLEILKLHDFNCQDLEDVGKLVNLTELSITNKKEEPIDIFRMCSPLKSIVNLDIEFAIIRIPKNHAEKQLWPQIESLDISNGVFYTSLPYLPTLKDLTIDDTHMSLTQVFGESVFSYGKTLEELRFCPEFERIIDADYIGIITKLQALKVLDVELGGDECMDGISQLENLEVLILGISPTYTITDSGAMMVINRCKKLRILDISSWYYLDSGLVMEAVTALRYRRPKADNPLIIHVNPGFPRVDKSKLGGVLDIKYNICKHMSLYKKYYVYTYT